MSTKPGATTSPSMSTAAAASSDWSRAASSTMRPSAMPTSARRRGAPVPSTISPPRKTRSSMLADLGFDDRPIEERWIGAGEVGDRVGEHEVAEVLFGDPLALHHLPRLFQDLVHLGHVPMGD